MAGLPPDAQQDRDEDPDLTMLTLGANPLLSKFLLGEGCGAG